MTDRSPEIVPFGESALLIVLGDEIDDEVNARVHRLAAGVTALRHPAIGTPVPAYASLLVPFDPVGADGHRIHAALEPLLAEVERTRIAAAGESLPVEIGARYGGRDGPDLDEVADRAGLRPEDVVELHASVDYRVHFLGFAPGFAYLARVPAEIVTPRRATPRERVPAGSIGIAGEQTAIYPAATPGGWQLIGRTDAPVWNPRRVPPALLAAGMRVRFVPLRD